MHSEVEADATGDRMAAHLEDALSHADDDVARYHIRAALQYRFVPSDEESAAPR